MIMLILRRQLDTYEILVGNMQGLRWVSAHGRLNLAALNARPVEGGRDPDGTPIYIAKAPHKGAEHPGKASERLDGAPCIPVCEKPFTHVSTKVP